MTRRYKLDKSFTKYILGKHKGSVVQAAETIGCHPETIRRACKKHGIKLKFGRKNSGTETRRKWSKFSDWLRANPTVPLAETIAGISDQSKCSYKTVWMYFYNRRKRAKSFLSSEPWKHGGSPVMLETTRGVRIPDLSFKVCSWSVSRPTGRIRIRATLHTKQTYYFEYSLTELKKLYKA